MAKTPEQPQEERRQREAQNKQKPPKPTPSNPDQARTFAEDAREKAGQKAEAERRGLGKSADAPTADKAQKASTASQEKGLLRKLQDKVRGLIPDKAPSMPTKGGLAKGVLKGGAGFGAAADVYHILSDEAANREGMQKKYNLSDPDKFLSWENAGAALQEQLMSAADSAVDFIPNMFGADLIPFTPAREYAKKATGGDGGQSQKQTPRPDWDTQYLPEKGEGPVTFSNGTVRPEFIREGDQFGFSFGNGQQALLGYSDDPDGSKSAAFQERLRNSIAAGAYDRRQPKLTDQQNQLLQLSQYLGVPANALAGASTYGDALEALGGYRKNTNSDGGPSKQLQADFGYYGEEDAPLAHALVVDAQKIARDPNASEAMRSDPAAAALLDHIARNSNNFGGTGWFGTDHPSRAGYMKNFTMSDWYEPSEEWQYARSGDGVFGLDTDQFDDLPTGMQSRLFALLRALSAENAPSKPAAK